MKGDQSNEADPGCYTYVDYVMHIPSFEPEFFRSCNQDVATLNSRGVQIQCTSYLGALIQTLANKYCTLIT